MPLLSRIRSRLAARSERSFIARELALPATHYLRLEEIAGGPLLLAAAAALLWANPDHEGYQAVWNAELTLELWGFALQESLRHWIDSLLLPLFFFVAGLEIKRELVRGQLSHWRTAAFPLCLALGGMIAPALIYLAVNVGDPAVRGWGIPLSTDIAFAIGVLALLGDRIPRELKVLVLAFAAVDDVGAVLIIGMFYSSTMSLPTLAVAALVLAVIVGLKVLGVRSLAIYWFAGAVFLLAMLKSGVHTTVAGVTLGLLAPARPLFSRNAFLTAVERLTERLARARARVASLTAKPERERSPEEQAELQTWDEREDAMLGHFEEVAAGTEPVVDRLIRATNPWVSYVILPLFALASAGVALSPQALQETTTSRVALGVAAGLLLGKPLGFLGSAWLAQRLGWAKAPTTVSWHHLVGTAILAGIGFTISLFVAELSFGHQEARLTAAKVSVLSSSVVAGIAGFLFLRATPRRPGPPPP
jgi:NhaA family Na+:H+ antiporter